MIAETLSVSTPTRLAPSKTSGSTTHPPTVFSDAHLLQPRVNGLTGCCTNKVVINLSTALVIPDYSRYYDGPVESFQPAFYSLNDGSLLTSAFVEDLAGANASLLVTGMLTMLFVRNIIVSGDYIRRGKVKKKKLFYILFFSQILAPVSFVPVIMSYFNQSLNCTIVVILSCVSGTVSLALLITGILGVKAYKCLNNSRFVLIMLGLFQCASTGTIAIDISTMHGERRLSGSCTRVSDLLCTRIFILIQFAESLFICVCFSYACWRSHSSSARGRISIRLSMEELEIDIPQDNAEKQPTLRGWWDYVPNNNITTPQLSLKPERDRAFRKVRSWLIGLLRQTKKGPHPPSLSPTSITTPQNPRRQHSATQADRTLMARGSSPTPSSLSRLSRFVPTMELFRKVMKDELMYTTVITATCVVVAVLAIIGVNFKNGLTVSGWILLNWSVISLLAIHSFGRVVHRHEREALLQHPSTCNTITRTGNVIAERRQRESRVSVNPHPQGRREVEENDRDDPFSDIHQLGDSRRSWDSRNSNFPTSTSPLSSSFPVVGPPRIDPTILPSPSGTSNSPISTHNDGASIQESSQSWLVRHVSFSPEMDKRSENLSR